MQPCKNGVLVQDCQMQESTNEEIKNIVRRLNSMPEEIQEEHPISLEWAVSRWILILVVIMLVGLTAIMNTGCGSHDTPSQVVEKFYKYTQENDCQKVADLVSDTSQQPADTYVNDCKKYADKIVGYSIGQTTYVTSVSAAVETEVTIKENGVEKTNSAPQFLVKSGDDWKLTKPED